MALHLSRVAYGCDSLSALQARLDAHAAMATASGLPATARLTTRYRPKRADEIIGGSLYWIIAHRIVARSPVLGFAEADGGRTDIIVAAEAIPVMAQPRRSHQGWRYLEEADRPRDLGEGGSGAELLPDALRDDLSAIGLV